MVCQHLGDKPATFVCTPRAGLWWCFLALVYCFTDGNLLSTEKERERACRKWSWRQEAPKEMGISRQQIQCKNNLFLANKKQKVFWGLIMSFLLLMNL